MFDSAIAGLRTGLTRHPLHVVALLSLLSMSLFGWMLARTPVAHGDSGEYLLTVEAFENHGTPDVR
jgi:hypothetical protein